MLDNRDLLKVIWLEAPESSIHVLVLGSKHLHKSLPKSIGEVHTIIPTKLTTLALDECEFPSDLPVSPFPTWNCWSKLISCSCCSSVKSTFLPSSYVLFSFSLVVTISMETHCTLETTLLPLLYLEFWL